MNVDQIEVDHVVIGAGIVGCATAFFLATAGRSVLVLEADEPGAGASGGPGMRGVRTNNRDPRELALARESQRWWPLLDRELGTATGFEQRGGLELFEADAVARNGGLQRLQAKQTVQRNWGLSSEILDRSELIGLLPDLNDTVTHALWSPDDGVAPQAQATRAFAEATAARGGMIIPGTTVDGIVERDSGGQLITTQDGRRFTAERSTVIAANYHSKALVSAAFGINLPLWPTAFHVCFAEPHAPYALPYLIGHDSRLLAVKQVGTAAQVSGFLTAPWDVDRGVSLATDSLFEQTMQTFRTVFRGFGPYDLTGTEGRIESSTPDGLQIIDRVPGCRDVFLAAGWSGHGFATAPAVGEALSSWLVTGKRPSLLAGLGLGRFGL